jgi:hypothetical protein
MLVREVSVQSLCVGAVPAGREMSISTAVRPFPGAVNTANQTERLEDENNLAIAPIADCAGAQGPEVLVEHRNLAPCYISPAQPCSAMKIRFSVAGEIVPPSPVFDSLRKTKRLVFCDKQVKHAVKKYGWLSPPRRGFSK